MYVIITSAHKAMDSTKPAVILRKDDSAGAFFTERHLADRVAKWMREHYPNNTYEVIRVDCYDDFFDGTEEG